MQMLKCLFVCCIIYASSNAQDYQDYQDNAPRQAPIRLRSNPGLSEHTRPTPVPILKQINKHNEDGSYTYGFEGADGSFKIETKLATGEVKGKYGYVDETGKVRVVEYGANKYGFQPSGEGITVAPPTLVDETRENDLPEYEDEPQVRPQRPHRVNRPQQQQQYRPVSQQPRQQPQYIQYDDEEAEPELPRRVQYATATSQHSQPQLQLQRASVAPLPPRVQVAGAQRVSDVLYTASPRPERPHFEYSQSTSFGDASGSVRAVRPSYAPAPAPPAPSSARAQGFLGPASGGRPHLEPFQYGPTQPSSPAQSAPQLGYHQPQPQQQPQFQSKSGTSSLLDQLARDYALPENSAQPLHDISFGYYQ